MTQVERRALLALIEWALAHGAASYREALTFHGAPIIYDKDLERPDPAQALKDAADALRERIAEE